MPGVCLSCGAHAPLAPRKFVFNVATTFGTTLMVMSPPLWAIYSRCTAYRPELPICGGCGFIHFAGANDCKKCATPLGRTAAA